LRLSLPSCVAFSPQLCTVLLHYWHVAFLPSVDIIEVFSLNHALFLGMYTAMYQGMTRNLNQGDSNMNTIEIAIVTGLLGLYITMYAFSL